VDRHSRLGAAQFEELQIMKFAWRNTISDLAAWNLAEVKEVDLQHYTDFLEANEMLAKFDKQEDEMVVDF
jgi:hypothetical protein